MEKQHILLVEDDINFGNLLRDTLSFNDYEVTLERDGVQGLRAFKQGAFDLCIFDIMCSLTRLFKSFAISPTFVVCC